MFPVNAPVTGIIGPNGCGKSNIIDAVRWVLGESSARYLRGKAIADVIFAGSKNRPRAGLASVSLEFDNHDGSAPGAFQAYAEIVVQRRIDSEGVSQFFINHQRCRRKDVVELLQGTGVGARSYAVIEQSMVSRIVEAKPEELRGFIEEAAGIGVYKTKRQESERRMAQVSDYLLHHQERLNVLESNRDQLAVQADVAKNYRTTQAQLRQTERELYSWQLFELRAAQSAQQDLLMHMAADLTSRTEKIQRLEASAKEQQGILREHQSAYYQAKNQCDTARKSYQAASHALERKQVECQHLRERLAEIEDRLRSKEAQKQEDSAERVFQEKKRDALAQALARLTEQLAPLARELETREQQQTAAERAHHETAEKCRALRNELLREKGRLTQLDARLQKRLARQAQQQATAEEALDAQQLAEKQRTINALETTQKALKTQLEHKTQEASEAKSATKARRQTLNEYQMQHTQCRARYTALQDWLPKPQANRQGEAKLAMTEMRVAAPWQAALESVLNQALHAAVGKEAAESWIEAGATPAQWQDIVHTPLAVSGLLAHLFPLAVHDSDINFEQLPDNQVFLSLDGSLVAHHFCLKNDAENQLGLLAKIEEAQQLQTQLAELQSKLNAQDACCKVAEASQQRLTETLQSLQQQSASNQQKLDKARYAAQAFSQLLAAQEKARQEKQETLAFLTQEITEIQEEKSQSQAMIAKLEAQLASFPAVDALQEKKQRCAVLTRQAREAWQKHKAVIEEKQQAQIALTSALQAKAEQLARLTQEINAIQTQQQTLGASLQAQQKAMQTAQLETETLGKSLETLERRVSEKKRVLVSYEQETANTSQQLNEERQARAIAQEKQQSAEERYQRLVQDYQEKVDFCAQEEIQVLDRMSTAAVNEVDLQAKLRHLKKRLASYGNVNFAAVDAYAEVVREYESLSTQIEDLHSSLAILEKAIAALDHETRDKLTTTFTEVNRHFATLFPILFRGGEGQIAWTSDDVLTAGIELSVRPPGKKIKHLSALSGGEKALTAIALIFSFFKLNPAPFCLLDEIDAPLDEANVGRLCALLREMSQQTQFIMITHHKRSMQACDHLIGVTMSEPGVSRLVSVAFDEYAAAG